jgi:O-antigen ligase
MLNTGTLLHSSSGNAFEKFAFLLSAIVLVMTRPLDRFIMGLLGAALFLVFALALMTTYSDFSWAIFLNSLNQIFILYALLAAQTTYRDQQVVWEATAFMPLLCVILGIAYQAVGINKMFAVEYATGVPRYVGSLSAAAFTSALGMLGVFSAVQLFLSGRQRYAILVVVNLMVLLAAGGRATLFIAVVLSALSLLLSRRMSFGNKIIWIVTGIVAGVAALPFFWDTLAKRISESGDSGRGVMWEYLETIIDQYPLAGIGFGHQFFSMPREMIIKVGSAAAHNDYLRLSVELGRPGMVIFYTLLTIAVFKASFSKGNRNYVAVTAYLGFLLLSNSDNALASPLEFPLIFLALLATHTKPATKAVRQVRQRGGDFHLAARQRMIGQPAPLPSGGNSDG